MTAILDQTVDALRNELQQCGEMLALLEAQGGLAMDRGHGPSLLLLADVNAQAAILHSIRGQREDYQRQLAWGLERPDGAALQELIPLLPEAYRPLVTALLRENLQLLRRIRERAGLNHQMLRRSLDRMQSFITTLSSPDPAALLGEEPDSSTAEPDRSTDRAAVG
jgi:hypothetical protein